MTLKLNSESLEFSYQLENGRWFLKHPANNDLWIASAPLILRWHSPGTRSIWLSDRSPTSYDPPSSRSSLHGESISVVIRWEPESEPIRMELEVYLLSELPLILWRTTIMNVSDQPIYLDRITSMWAGNSSFSAFDSRQSSPGFSLDPSSLLDGGMSLSRMNEELAFFTNGWQSWNYAGALSREDRFPQTRLGPLVKPMRLDKGTPRIRGAGHFHSHMFAVLGDRHSRQGWLTGYLTQQQAFGHVEAWVKAGSPAIQLWSELDGVRVHPEATFSTDWAAIELIDLDKSLSDSGYCTAVANENRVTIPDETPTGWCSWYHAFEHVTQDHIQINAEKISDLREWLPLDLVQLDDGYARKVGDWFDLKDEFPHGLKAIAEKIAESGARAGLWLAPFVASRGSDVARRHPDWILRNRIGLPVNPGFLWNSFPVVFDITNPEVLDHVAAMINKCVHGYGFEYLKLDFIYAGALGGSRFDLDVTRAQALRNALLRIRQVAGEEVRILGCGCPIGSGIGIFDYMRVNPDVASTWLPEYSGIRMIVNQEEGLPGAKNAMITAINRSFMHQKWWINDPDCLILRDVDTGLARDEIQTLATVIALSGGSLISSDHLPDLSGERLEWLMKLLPPLPHSARVLDWFDTPIPSIQHLALENQTGIWHLLGLINWKDDPADLQLDLGAALNLPHARYHAIDFWNETYWRNDSSTLEFKNVPAHGVRFIALREIHSGAQWVGSTLHTSQGLFVRQVHSSESTFSSEVDLQRSGSGLVWLQVPDDPISISFEGVGLSWETEGRGIVRVELSGIRQGILVASWR